MPAEITFTDTIGPATLRNNRPEPADRFTGWTPDSKPVGTIVYAQARGRAGVLFRTGDIYSAAFRLPSIRAQVYDGVSMLDVADRLRYHLLNGGTCEVDTNDDEGRIYTCALAEGATPSLTLADRVLLEYALDLVLVNVGETPGAMICHYGGMGGSW